MTVHISHLGAVYRQTVVMSGVDSADARLVRAAGELIGHSVWCLFGVIACGEGTDSTCPNR